MSLKLTPPCEVWRSPFFTWSQLRESFVLILVSESENPVGESFVELLVLR